MKKRNWRLMLRRVLNLVLSRIVVTGVLLLLQAFWLFALFYWLADYAKWFGGVGVAMSIIMCLALIRQDSTVPEFKISWMILFAVMPVQGGILYLLWGNKRPALGLRHRLERAEDAMAPARKDDPDAAAALQRQDPRAALPPATLLCTCHLGTPCVASCSQPTSFIKYAIFSIVDEV